MSENLLYVKRIMVYTFYIFPVHPVLSLTIATHYFYAYQSGSYLGFRVQRVGRKVGGRCSFALLYNGFGDTFPTYIYCSFQSSLTLRKSSGASSISVFEKTEEGYLNGPYG